MPITSTYIQIAEYAVVEYFYSSEILTTAQAKAIRLYNNYSRQYQFLNNAGATRFTENVLDSSAVQLGIGSTRWGYLDTDVLAPLIQIDPNISVEDISNLLLPNIKYDMVRVHLLSGFDLPGLDGIIMQVLWRQWDATGSGGTAFAAASQVYIKGDERLQFNTKPLFLGDRLFDRYIQFKVPSLADVNFDYWNAPNAANTIGNQYTFGNVGFQQESQIEFKLFEIDRTEIERGNQYFITGEEYLTSFNQSDLYSYISSVIRENPVADFLEYYPTWNGQFLEDYIGLLNAGGGNWVVINQLDVYEQLGANFAKTFSMTSLQDSNFNEPSAFRPIIRNAALAISYSVEYTMRLLNKANNQEIIRKATFTSMDPKKYGAQLEKINVLEGFRPIKVYNKVVRLIEDDGINTSVQYMGSPATATQNVYVNSYYDVNYISVDSTTDLGTSLGQRVYPQGTNVIFLTPFDNYVKFKIFTKSADKKQDTTLDLASTGMSVKLAFIYSDNTRIYLDPTIDATAADPGVGEVLFRVDDSVAIKLLADSTRDYFIVNKNAQGDDVLIYSGRFASLNERKTDVESSYNTAQAQPAPATMANAPTAPTATTTAVPISAAAAQVGSVGNGALGASQSAEIAAAQAAVSAAQSAVSAVDAAIQNAFATNTIQNLNIVDVPGVVSAIAGASISAAITPAVIKPSDPASKVSVQSVSASALTKPVRSKRRVSLPKRLPPLNRP